VAPERLFVYAYQNEREDYALVYPRFAEMRPITIALIGGVRHTLNGFQAEDVNAHGAMCGTLELTRNTRVGVTWQPGFGFRFLQGGATAYPNYIGDDGIVGGSIGTWNNPCLWVGNNVITFPEVLGTVSFIDNSGVVAGFWQDGGHGTHPWLGNTQGKASYVNGSVSFVKSLPNNLYLAQYATAYGGGARIFDRVNLTLVSIWPYGANIVSDMNSSFVGVGNTYHDIGWGRPQPAMWIPSGHLQWQKIDPYQFLPSRWTEMAPRAITDVGIILATARNHDGQMKLFRLRPRR